MDVIRASCNCGIVTFESSENPIIQLCCHCSDCRAATNTPFSEIAFFKVKSAKVEGEISSMEFISHSKSNTKREYCSVCSTIMFDRSSGFPSLVGVFINRLQSPFSPHIDSHVWVKSKSVSVDIPLGVKVYEEGIS